MTRKSRTVEEDHPWSTYAGTPPIHGRLRDFLDMLWCLGLTEEVRFSGRANGAPRFDAATMTAHLSLRESAPTRCYRSRPTLTR